MLAAATVIAVPATVPKLPAFPVTAEFASLQLAVVKVKVELTVSVICTAVLKAAAIFATGEVGAATPTVDVVMLAGAALRLVTAKLNGPPSPPVVIFCTATVADFAVLVKTQVICAACTILAAAIVSTLPDKVPKLAGLPVVPALASLHVAAVAVKLPFAASVICTAVLLAVVAMLDGNAGVGVATAAVVIALGAAARLVAVKLNVPTAQPDVIF